MQFGGVGTNLRANLMQLATGKPTKFGAEAVRFAERCQPGGSLWYTRLAMERLISDELERMADPDAAPRFRRIEQRARRETGQQFFWRPGRRGPERAPDLAAVFRR